MNRKKRVRRKRILLLITILFLIIFVFINLPFFNVSTVYIKGNKELTNEEIMNMTDLGTYRGNIFYYSKNKYEDILEENPYVSSGNIHKIYPSTIEVEIEEREVVAYVMYSESTYLYIDKEGNVLEVKNNCNGDLPVISGLSIDGYAVGQALNIDDREVFDTTLTLSNLFKRYNIVESGARIDLSDINNIVITVGNIKIFFGSIDNADEKMQKIVSSIGPLKEANLDAMGGYYHIEDINRDPYFEIAQ